MKPVSQQTRDSIASLVDHGLSTRRIAAQLGISYTTVSQVRSRVRPDASKSNDGRPSKLSAADKRKDIGMVTSGQVDTAVQATRQLKSSTSAECSAKTIYSKLYSLRFAASPDSSPFRSRCQQGDGKLPGRSALLPVSAKPSTVRPTKFRENSVVPSMLESGPTYAKPQLQSVVPPKLLSFLVVLCPLETALALDIRQTIFTVIDGVNATIANPLASITGWNAVACADACLRNANCRVFSLETRPSTTVCQLGSNVSAVSTNPAGMSASLFVDQNLIPPDYAFAMITTKIHFLKNLAASMNFPTGVAACQPDKANLVQDDKGVAWHNFLLQYATSKIGPTSNFWVGGNDLDGNHVYYWNDGTPVSGQTFWYPGQPSFNFNGIPEQCMELRWTLPWATSTFIDQWNDARCSDVKAVFCEFRLP
ncbi:unnamed protein product [Darwinula stevensoni]|uniref:C-type lectin domain-containing protein n=1 Tax=Darwinula stevensoni TaxID=69355 RepID=A0A7R9AH38_9CRUS|nr:unnamed protein product [Darwinula stevensoni]CAG0904026.1 unnamed protein product [Darwinula stevensoni]